MVRGSNSVRTFVVLLDNPSRSYFAGQAITGHLILDLDRERKTRGLKINFVGRADVKWKESHIVVTGVGSRSHTEYRTYSDREVYFDKKVYLIGSSGGPEVIIPPGHHEFPIGFQLPLGIPSSFQGQYGHIQYTISATIKTSWEFDKTTTTPFTVNSLVDLNKIRGAKVSSQFSKHKDVGCLCCKDGPISFVFKLARRGFVPGEGLDFIVEMNNQSSKPVPRIQIQLKRNVSYHARGGTKNESGDVTGCAGPGVAAYETEIWRSSPNDFRTPAIPPTNLGGCRIIGVGYSIHVEMEIPSGFNLKGSTAIIIGTIPFRNRFAQIRPSLPEPSSIPVNPAVLPNPTVVPSARPLSIAGYPDLPPPTYQDAFIGELPTYADAIGADGAEKNGGGDKKTQEIAFDPNFIPKYATYGWLNRNP